MRRLSPTNPTAGFTLVELVAALPIIIIVITIFVATLITSLHATTAHKIQLELNNANQYALSTIERDIRYGKEFSSVVPSPFTDPYLPAAYTNGWTIKGPANAVSGRTLIIKSYATTTNVFNIARKGIYIDEAAYDCSPTGTLYLNNLLPYMTIFFVDNGVLYRRLLTDTSTQVCSGQTMHQKQTCPPNINWISTLCKANDEMIARNVTGLSVEYYAQTDTPLPAFEPITDAYTSADPALVATAENVNITLTMQKTANSKPVTSQLQLTASMVNSQ